MGRRAQKAKSKKAQQNDGSDSGSDSGDDRSSSASSSSEEEEQTQRQQTQQPGGKKGGKPKPKAKGKQSKAETTATQQQQQNNEAAKSPEDGAAAAAASSSAASASKRKPVQVIYCPISGWPAEMCEYNGNFAKCKQWHIDNADLLDADKEKLEETSEELGRKQKVPGQDPLLRKEGPKEVTIDERRRTGRKFITVVKGLDLYGHPLHIVAHNFKKKFSCGCAVAEAPNPGMLGSIEIQGKLTQELLKLLPGKDFGVPADKIVLFRNGKPASGEGGAGGGDGDGKDDDAGSEVDE